MKHKGIRRTVSVACLAAAVALSLSGCSVVDGVMGGVFGEPEVEQEPLPTTTTIPTEGGEEPEEPKVALTEGNAEPGQNFDKGEPGSVLYVKDSGDLANLTVSLKEVSQGSNSDFSVLSESVRSQLREYSPFYLRFTVGRSGSLPVEGVDVSDSLWPLFGDGTQAHVLRVVDGRFPDCQAKPLSAALDLDEGAEGRQETQDVCVIGLVRSGSSISAGSYYQPKNGIDAYRLMPVTWGLSR